MYVQCCTVPILHKTVSSSVSMVHNVHSLQCCTVGLPIVHKCPVPWAYSVRTIYVQCCTLYSTYRTQVSSSVSLMYSVAYIQCCTLPTVQKCLVPWSWCTMLYRPIVHKCLVPWAWCTMLYRPIVHKCLVSWAWCTMLYSTYRTQVSSSVNLMYNVVQYLSYTSV